MKFLFNILSILILVYTASSFAWREVGHFSVCEIAYQNLTLTAKEKVDSILQGKSFAEQCTWPDMVRKSKEWKHTYDWHFVNIEDDQEYFTSENINQNGDVMTAILTSMSNLSNPRISLSKKRSSLLFLGHFVGDIHQVVHIGRKSDLGGNKLYATWFDEERFDDIEHLRAEGEVECLGPLYRDEPTGECVEVNSRRSSVNLHKIWDLLMVDRFISERGIRSNNQYPYKEYVKEIDHVSKRQVSLWRNSYVLDWAQESLCYRPWLYHVGDKQLGEEYYQKHIKTLNRRILMAGYRLGTTLNRIFDPAIRRKFSNLLKKERELINSLKALMQGKESAHHLSLVQCSIGVYQAP